MQFKNSSNPIMIQQMQRHLLFYLIASNPKPPPISSIPPPTPTPTPHPSTQNVDNSQFISLLKAQLQFIINSLYRMKKQYHFCFQFTRIGLLNEIPQTLNFFTHYKIYLFHSTHYPIQDNSVIGQTNSILCIPNQQGEIVLERESIRCSLAEQNFRFPSNLEIKLTEILETDEEKLIGSYQFSVNNYIHINEQFNRHCVELNVQIGENFQINYEVFIDRCREGVDQIMQEHCLSKSLIRDECGSDDFLPEEMEPIQSKHKLREIKLDNDDYVVLNQRYWSPTWLQAHNSPKKEVKRKIFTNKYSMNETFYSKGDHEISQSLETKRMESTIDDGEERLALSQVRNESIMNSEIGSNSDHMNDDKDMEELYQVISWNSKIKLPEDDEVQFSKHPQPPLKRKPMQVNRSYSHAKIAKNMNNVSIIVILIVLAAMFLLHSTRNERQSHPSARYQKKNTLYI